MTSIQIARTSLALFLFSMLILALFVYFSGSTFGQRCDKLYPKGSALDKERCVEKLSHGIPL